jgi:hypothetical protein
MSRLEAPIAQIWAQIWAQNWALGLSPTAEFWPTFCFDEAVWVSFLVAVRLTFWVYNQFGKEARMWIYPFLQTQRMFGFTLLVGTNPIGAVLLMSLVLARWLQYCIYRCEGDRWQFPVNVGCLLIFGLLFMMILIGSPNPAELLTWQAVVAFGYCAIKSNKTMARIKSGFRLVRQRADDKAL